MLNFNFFHRQNSTEKKLSELIKRSKRDNVLKCKNRFEELTCLEVKSDFSQTHTALYF